MLWCALKPAWGYIGLHLKEDNRVQNLRMKTIQTAKSQLLFKNQSNYLQMDWFGAKSHFDSVPGHFQNWNISWHIGQRSLGVAQSSDRPATVRGCWWINKKSRKWGLTIRSYSISEESEQPISLLTGTISTTTLHALYNCCFRGHKKSFVYYPFLLLDAFTGEKKIIL